ncbi:MAG: Rrf2 family transcriptional regulator [Rubrobacter sp.]
MRLELGSEGRYGLRALIHLAQSEGMATADTISTEAEVPRRLLARIMAKLSHAGIVASQDGRGGGSRLNRPPEKITLKDAVEALEGPFEVTRCIMEQRACGEGPPCTMHEAWEEGQEAILQYLETQTLSDFVSTTTPSISTTRKGE